jgi:hypothetical protein
MTRTLVPSDPYPLLHDIRTGINRGFTYGLFGEAEQFMPQARTLGARFMRVNLFWSQIEPEPGIFVWDAVDTFLDQLQEGDEAWVTVCSSSPWATRRATRFLPSSPAEDIDRYRGFVSRLVRRGQGRVRFWQCEVEPCIPLLWSGTASDYIAHLHAFHDAVKQAAPDALIALGGAVPGAMLADDQGGNRLWIDYFDRILRDGGKDFDLFDMHPYGDPYAIPALIEACHKQMAVHGYSKPIAASEYSGPMPTSFPANLEHLTDVLDTYRRQFQGLIPVAAGGARESPAQPAMANLYERMATLPPTLQMFMTGCSPDLERKRHRLNGSDMVMRTIFLLSTGVRRAAYFQLAPDERDRPDRRTIRALMFGKFPLMDYDGEKIGRRHPTADTFELMSRHLEGVCEVRQIKLTEHPDLYIFDVYREQRGPLLIVWRRCDDVNGEETSPISFSWQWPVPTAHAVDACGAGVPVELTGGRLHLPLSDTPVFVTMREKE